MGLPSSTRYANGWPHSQQGYVIFATLVICCCSGYALVSSWWLVSYWCRVLFAKRVDTRYCRNVFGASDSKHYMRQCGMSGVAFCTAPPIGGPFCYFYTKLQLQKQYLSFHLDSSLADWYEIALEPIEQPDKAFVKCKLMETKYQLGQNTWHKKSYEMKYIFAMC